MEEILQQKPEQSQDGDLCAVMDEALYFLSTTIILNLEMLQVVVNVLERRVTNETAVLRSVYQSYIALQNYDSIFNDKVQRLFDSQNSISSDLFRRFYSRVSEKLLLKVLFFNLNRKSLGFISRSLLDMLEVHDSTESCDSFNKYIRIMSLVIHENKALIHMLISMIVEENMVSSEEEFLRVMEKPELRRDRVSMAKPATIGKLGIAARKYKDSNQMNKLLNSFFASIKNDASIFENEGNTLFKKFTHFRTSIDINKRYIPPYNPPYGYQTTVSTSMKIPRKKRSRQMVCIDKISDRSSDSETESLQKQEVKSVTTSTHRTSIVKRMSSVTCVPTSMAMKLPPKTLKKTNTVDRSEIKNRFELRKKIIQQQTQTAILEEEPEQEEQEKRIIKEIKLPPKRTTSVQRRPSSYEVPSRKSFRSDVIREQTGRLSANSLSSSRAQTSKNTIRLNRSRFAKSRKLKQYTSGFPDKKRVLNWDEFGLNRKQSYRVNNPMAISKDLIVGMKFKRSGGEHKVESLSNMNGQIVHLEYLNKIDEGKVDDNSKFTIELNMIRYKGQEPPRSASVSKCPSREKLTATPSTITPDVTNRGGSNHLRMGYEMLDRGHKRILSMM